MFVQTWGLYPCESTEARDGGDVGVPGDVYAIRAWLVGG